MKKMDCHCFSSQHAKLRRQQTTYSMMLLLGAICAGPASEVEDIVVGQTVDNVVDVDAKIVQVVATNAAPTK